MAINAQNVEKIEGCFREISPESKIKKEGPKEDGGYESVSTNVPELNSWQLQRLTDLDKSINNSFLMKRSGTGIKLLFY